MLVDTKGHRDHLRMHSSFCALCLSTSACPRQIIREAELNEKLSRQGTAGGGQIKDGSNTLGQLVKLHSARGSSSEYAFIIPADFTGGSFLLPSWMQSWYLESDFGISMVSVIRHALHKEDCFKDSHLVIPRIMK